MQLGQGVRHGAVKHVVERPGKQHIIGAHGSRERLRQQQHPQQQRRVRAGWIVPRRPAGNDASKVPQRRHGTAHKIPKTGLRRTDKPPYQTGDHGHHDGQPQPLMHVEITLLRRPPARGQEQRDKPVNDAHRPVPEGVIGVRRRARHARLLMAWLSARGYSARRCQSAAVSAVKGYRGSAPTTFSYWYCQPLSPKNERWRPPAARISPDS